jgi:hypothetical protein
MRKRSPKVGSINICLPCTFWEKEAMTPGTKYIDGVIPRQIRETHRKDWLPLAENVWTTAKGCGSVFFVHCVHSAIGDNIPAVVNTAINVYAHGT